MAFLEPNELSVIERCPYYRGVRKERLDRTSIIRTPRPVKRALGSVPFGVLTVVVFSWLRGKAGRSPKHLDANVAREQNFDEILGFSVPSLILRNTCVLERVQKVMICN